jgi:phosphonate transport system substrate-binding protein
VDSGIQDVKDLKGKKILFGGGKKAMVAYVVNTYTLRQAGLGPNDYTELFAVNPPNATIATYFGRADAAGIGDVGLRIPILKTKGVDVGKMKLVGVSQALPHLVWAVKRTMSKEDKENIQMLLVNLNNIDEGKLILSSAKLTGLKKAEDKDYKIHREILEYYRQNYRAKE